MNTRVFNSGEYVYVKGSKLAEFYSIRKGRFAVILPDTESPSASGAPASPGKKNLFVLDRPGQVFGEIDAFLTRPQRFSALALESSEAAVIPTEPYEQLEASLAEAPNIALSVCISFAGRLKLGIDTYMALLGQETGIDQLIIQSCRSFQANLAELDRMANTVGAIKEKCPLLVEKLPGVHEFPLSALAEQLLKTGISKSKGSISNCVIRPPSGNDQVVEFPAGACICKKGTMGDKMFILIDGSVEVILSKETRIPIDQPGSMVGEIAVLLNMATGKPDIQRTADVVCVTPVRSLVLGLDNVETYLRRHPEVSSHLVSAMVSRSKNTDSLIEGTRDSINTKLFSDLKACLQGIHQLASLLAPYSKEPLLSHSFASSAQQARLIYDKFAAAKEFLKEVKI